jgi:hypothetical protein
LNDANELPETSNARASNLDPLIRIFLIMKKVLALICLLTSAAGVLAEQIVAVTSDNRLFFFDHATPGTISRSVTVTGLQSGETIFGIDFRPTTGQLYALGSTSRLYQLNVTTGAATAVGAAGQFSVVGTNFGFDFNPTVDRIRITSDSDQNIRVNPNDGALTATDVPLTFAPGDPNAGMARNVTASAYTNSFAGAGATVLYDIDAGVNALLIQNPPNAGTLTTVGSLGVDPAEAIGFDISGVTGRAYASMAVGTVTGLYTIDLASGAATLVGEIGDAATRGSANVIDIALFTPTRFKNLSTRGRVGTGNDVLIGGLITQGAASTNVLFRAIGPSLSGSGVPNLLADPVLTVYDSSGTAIGTNDDWRNSPRVTEIMNSGLQPTDDRESALLLTLAPGAYTGIVSGKGGATGIALVETYEL